MMVVDSGWLLFTELQLAQHPVSLILLFSLTYSNVSKANA